MMLVDGLSRGDCDQVSSRRAHIRVQGLARHGCQAVHLSWTQENPRPLHPGAVYLEHTISNSCQILMHVKTATHPLAGASSSPH